MARIRIVKIPKAEKGIDLGAGAMGTNDSRQFSLNSLAMSGKMAEKPIEARQTLGPVPRDEANLEAEKGETAVVNMNGMPAHFKIGGKRHSQGGTPLDLPDNSFIFSDTAKMKIKDPIIQAQFGMAFKKGGYTPADIAKKYDINKYRKTLADPDSEDIDRNTAEMMISNYNLKLAKLGLVQESIKGFPQGIPVIAMPYIMTGQIDPSEFLPDQAQQQQEGAAQPDANMGTARYGGLPRAQDGIQPSWAQPTQSKRPPLIQLPTPTSKIEPSWVEAEKNKRPSAIPIPKVGKPGKQYVRKGWGNTWFKNDTEAEEEFAQGENKITYDLYKKKMLMPEKTLEEQKAKVEALNEAIVLIDEGLETKHGFGDFTQAGKLKDLRDILHEEILRFTNPEAYKNLHKGMKGRMLESIKKRESYDKGTALQVNQLINHYAKLRDAALARNDDAKATHAENKLNELYKLAPSAKASSMKQQAILNSPTTINGMVYPKDPSNKLYSDEESTLISNNLKDIKEKEEAYKNKLISEKNAGTDALKESIKATGFDFFNPDPDIYGTLDKQQKAFIERLYNQPKFKNLRDTYFEEDGGSIYRNGGSLLLPKAQDGLKFKKKLTTTTTSGTKGTKIVPGVKLTPEEEEIRRKNAETTPDKTVSDEDYEKLKQLYIEAAKSSGAIVDDDGNVIKMGDVNKKTQQTLDFQKEYHRLLPNEARRIISSEKDPTTKGKGLSHGVKHDLAANEDEMFGKRTEQYWQKVKRAKPVVKKEKQDITLQKEENIPGARPDLRRNPAVEIGKKTYAPWWLQDIVKISGAAADKARLNQYLPYQQIPEVRLPEATLYDPTRELAANAEQANIQTQGMGAFAGPQALSARSSSIQGQALKNAADIEARYNNMNVGIANQLNQERTSIMNQAAQNRAGLNTQLWDKYTIANQQFDNSKAMARQNIRQSYIDGLTNRGKTQALNTLYPNFYTDPMTGFVNKTGYAAIDPTQASASEFKKIQTIMDTFPGTSFKDASAYVKGSKTADEESNQGIIGYPG